MFNRNQPRIPKHHHGGGRWTRHAYGMLSDVGLPRSHEDERRSQATLADLPQYAFRLNVEKRDLIVTDPHWAGRQSPSIDPAAAATAVTGWSLLDRLRGGISSEEARGWDEYERLSRENGDDGAAAITFKVGQYQRGFADQLGYERVERLTREQIMKLCNKFDAAQGLLNEAAKNVGGHGKFPSRAAYGRAVHAELQRLVKGNPDLGLEAELSFVFEGLKKVRPGAKGSVRPDVKQKEKGEDEVLCFLDAKTLDQRLRPWYMRKVARYALRTRNKAKRIIVIEIKPQE